MKGCASALIGLVIGAALSFAVLAAVALANNTAKTCAPASPQEWAVRVDVSRAMAQREVADQLPALARGSKVTITDVWVDSCGQLFVNGDLLLPNGWSVANVGVEFALAMQDGQVQVEPVALWMGRLSFPVRWLVPLLADSALQELDAILASALSEQLAGSGLHVCAIAGHGEGMLSGYLCAEEEQVGN